MPRNFRVSFREQSYSLPLIMTPARENEPDNTVHSHQQKFFRPGYRTDIEGLRAVAIILVVGHHAGVPWLTGGYVGVDVFFVISGYLITGLLLQEIASNGRVGLLDFYSRRLRRLLPALLFMVACTMFASAILLAPLEQAPQAQTARAASVWISNFFFAFSDFDYFAPDADTDLFLHTWSLGVEEQFYLTWPLLLMRLFYSLNVPLRRLALAGRNEQDHALTLRISPIENPVNA